MMWMRNVLFVGLIGGGLFVVGANLIPAPASKPVTHYDSAAYRDPGFRAAVESVDASFRRQWSADGLHPAQPAPELTVARRLALGLIGAAPSLEEIRQIESLPSEERLPWWIDHLAQDRRFADYFAERLARSYVGAEDGPFLLYRRRRFVSWLNEALARNRPYDQIVRDLIADEGLWTDKPATNFVSVTCQPDKQNQPDPARLAGRVTRAFLGLRLDCAQCHNHPFADWTKTDFEGLSAFFGQTHVGFTGIYDGAGEYAVEDRKTQAKKTIDPRVPFAEELLPDHGTRRQQLAGWVTHPRNPYFAKAAVNRVWALLFSRPLVDPVDNLQTTEPVPSALQILADDFVAHRYDLRRLIRVIASSEAFRLDSAAEGDEGEALEKAWAVFPLTRLRPEQVAGSVLQAASITANDADSNLFFRLIRYGQENEFVKRYGDSGEDEFDEGAGTIPQRLLLMNGKMVHEKTAEGPFNAATRIAWMAPDDPRAVEVAYLAVLTRRPTPAETAHFEGMLADKELTRTQQLEDLFWSLVNSTEFSWNH
jgi:hypothetical protein